jgi:hypothetical protein
VTLPVIVAVPVFVGGLCEHTQFAAPRIRKIQAIAFWTFIDERAHDSAILSRG